VPDVTTTQAFLQFEKILDVSTATYENLQKGIKVTSEAIRAAFPARTAPPAPSPPGNVVVIMGARQPRAVGLELVELRVMGSYARRTLVPRRQSPLFDIDIAAVFQADSPYDAYTSFGVEQLLREVADALASIGRPMTVWAGQAITVDFGAVNIDVWPAFRLWSGAIFSFPRRGNMWFRSNPQVFDERFANLDQSMTGRLASVARYMKVWNIRKGNLLPSFYLESLVMRELRNTQDENLQASVHRIFDVAKAHGQAFLSIGSEDGAIVDLAKTLSYQERVKVASAFAATATITAVASEYERDGKFAAANLCWRRVFGPAFPVEKQTDAELLADPELAWLSGLVRAEEGELGRADVLFRSAATAGHPDAALTLARLLSNRGDNDEAKQWLITAANRGIAGAAFTLAEQGGTDESERLAWHQRAADLGNPVAMITLGMRASSAGDLARAETWYRAAIAKGSTRAMVNLAIVLNRQPSRAAEVDHWLRMAAARGDLQARGLLADRLSTDASTEEEAEQLWESAADDGDVKSMISLARACERTGRIAEAANWYRNAANRGYKDAAIRLSQLGASGRFMKWRTGDRWVAVDPFAWGHERLREYYSANPDRAVKFEKDMRQQAGEVAVLILDPPPKDSTSLEKNPSESTHTEVSDDGTLFIASLAARSLIISAPADQAVPEQVAGTLVNNATRLAQQGRLEEAAAAYDQVLTHFRDATEPAVQVQVAGALYNKGLALAQLGRLEEAAGAYDQVTARFGDTTEHEVQERVAEALLNKGAMLGQLGRLEEAAGAYDQAVARFGDATEPGVREQVAKALVNKGAMFSQLGRLEEAAGAYDQVVARFGDDTEPKVREPVAVALVNKGVALGRLGRVEEAARVYDQVVARFGDATESAVREQIAIAQRLKAEMKSEPA
jgi:tetratricopeptide (TPR) repeat protein